MCHLKHSGWRDMGTPHILVLFSHAAEFPSLNPCSSRRLLNNNNKKGKCGEGVEEEGRKYSREAGITGSPGILLGSVQPNNIDRCCGIPWATSRPRRKEKFSWLSDLLCFSLFGHLSGITNIYGVVTERVSPRWMLSLPKGKVFSWNLTISLLEVPSLWKCWQSLWLQIIVHCSLW